MPNARVYEIGGRRPCQVSFPQRFRPSIPSEKYAAAPGCDRSSGLHVIDCNWAARPAAFRAP